MYSFAVMTSFPKEGDIISIQQKSMIFCSRKNEAVELSILFNMLKGYIEYFTITLKKNDGSLLDVSQIQNYLGLLDLLTEVNPKFRQLYFYKILLAINPS